MSCCPKCGESLDDRPLNPRAAFRYFRGHWSSWEDLFGEAAKFASELGPHRLISISHSEDANDGVITVWYWEEQS